MTISKAKQAEIDAAKEKEAADVAAKAAADAAADVAAKAAAATKTATEAQAAKAAEAEAKAVKKFPYSIAEGKSVTSKIGIIGPGEEAKAEYFANGQKTLDNLVKSKHVVKA